MTNLRHDGVSRLEGTEAARGVVSGMGFEKRGAGAS